MRVSESFTKLGLRSCIFQVEVRMIRNVRSPIGGCLIGRFALLHGVGCGTFPE